MRGLFNASLSLTTFWQDLGPLAVGLKPIASTIFYSGAVEMLLKKNATLG